MRKCVGVYLAWFEVEGGVEVEVEVEVEGKVTAIYWFGEMLGIEVLECGMQ